MGATVTISGACLLCIVLFSLQFVYLTFNEPLGFSIGSSALKEGGVKGEAQTSKSNIRSDRPSNTKKAFIFETSRMTEQVSSFF